MIGKRIGNYIIERTLAQGGMGAVFVARDRALGRRVAIKFIAQEPACTPEMARRFLDEARITASLQHPNIVTIFDSGEVEGRLYYVMELLTGRDLTTLMTFNRQFAIEQVEAYVTQICSGLHTAHAAGIVHRDLKPSNIFVLDGEPLRVKLMDFGVAKIVSTGDGHTYLGQVIGTPRYMSPEQAMGTRGQISPRCDIYSLGIILYEMLTGASVFESDSLMSQLMMHMQAPVPKIRSCAPEVPQEIAELVESCLAKDPNQRPQSALAVARRFAEAVSAFNQCDAPDRGARFSSDESVTSTGLNPAHYPLEGSKRSVQSDTGSSRPARRSLQPGIERPGDAGAPGVETPIPIGSNPRAIRLDKADRSTLNRLWSVLQKSEEFPKFVQSARELGKHSDFDNVSSAGELADSIIRDADLSAKLLRIVNAAYGNRFGGTVFNVQRAIVILGMDRVRSIALSVILFENQASDARSPRLAESAVNSLRRAEIAQQFAAYAQVEDAEQAMNCAMFRDLGRHLAIAYLPDLYDRIQDLFQSEEISWELASERVLGLSFRKLGLGAAERWRLPKSILGVMSNVPGLSGRWAHEEDRMVALAELSNELCRILTSAMPQTRPLAVANLLLRNKALITVDSGTIAELLQAVEESFERRYSSLIGLNSTKQGFSRQAVPVATQPASEVRTVDGQCGDIPAEGG